MSNSAVEGRIGIILANTGTPAEPTPKAVKRYLGRFLTDKRIMPMNPIAWRIILNLFILPKRSKVSAAKYESIWTDEGSPLQVTHLKLARALESRYQARGLDAVVELFLNYGDVKFEDVLTKLKDAGCERVVVLPLYPQSAYSTCACISDCIDQAMKKRRFDLPVDFVNGYSDNHVYQRAIAASIEAAGFDVDSDDRILFSFHSIPLNDIDAGDTYELQVGSSSLMIASELGIDRRRWTIGYQCPFDKGREWLKPFTPDVLKRWAETEGGRVFFVCPNFAVDCLETLYDVGHEIKPEYLKMAREAGREVQDNDFVYVPCLNATKAHIRVLTDVLKPYVEREAR